MEKPTNSELYKTGKKDGVKEVIRYLKREIDTQNARTAGVPHLKAHLNAVEKVVLQTVINALEEGINLS